MLAFDGAVVAPVCAAAVPAVDTGIPLGTTIVADLIVSTTQSENPAAYFLILILSASVIVSGSCRLRRKSSRLFCDHKNNWILDHFLLKTFP